MDLRSAYNQVIPVLHAPDFVDGTLRILVKERQIYQAEIRRYRQEQTWDISNLPLFKLLTIDKEIINHKRALVTHFETYAIAKLPQPAILSADDLQEVASSQLGGLSPETQEQQLQRFVYHVLLRINEFQGSEAKIDLGEWTKAGFESEEEYRDGPLWDTFDDGPIELPNGFALDVVIQPSDHLFNVHATGLIRGTCTRYSAERLAAQIGPVIESLFRSLKLASIQSELASARKVLEQFNPDEI